MSVEECRKHLGDKGNQMSDEEVVEIRDSLYGLAELALDCYFEEKKNDNSN
jgi:hypothetical protein